MKKTVFFGGTFDPVHNGHLALAREILDTCAFDQVLFVPLSVLPHTYKCGERVTAFHHRFAMLERAVAGEKGFLLSDIENRREGKSYTVDTLRLLRSQGIWGELTMLIGADSLLKLHTWKEARTLVKEFGILVYPRKGAAFPPEEDLAPYWDPESMEKLVSSFLPEKQEFDVSSTQIRQMIQKDELPALLPFVKKEVLDYITENSLYS